MGLGFTFFAYRSPDDTGITGSVRLSVYAYALKFTLTFSERCPDPRASYYIGAVTRIHALVFVVKRSQN